MHTGHCRQVDDPCTHYRGLSMHKRLIQYTLLAVDKILQPGTRDLGNTLLKVDYQLCTWRK